MPSIVGEALNIFGTEEQKQKYLKPYIAGELVAAEALTEPRGGSDFFGAMTRAELKGNHFILNGMKRFVVGAEGADFFLVYCKTNFDPKLLSKRHWHTESRNKHQVVGGIAEHTIAMTDYPVRRVAVWLPFSRMSSPLLSRTAIPTLSASGSVAITRS